jgi:hypothetical protein
MPLRPQAVTPAEPAASTARHIEHYLNLPKIIGAFSQVEGAYWKA